MTRIGRVVSVAYLNSQSAYAGIDGDWIVVREGDREACRWPLARLEMLVVVGRPSLSTSLLCRLLSERVTVSFVTVRGRYRGRLEPALSPAAGPRIAQVSLLARPQCRLPLVRALVIAKLEGQRAMVAQLRRGDPDLDLRDSIEHIDGAIVAARSAQSADTLRGHEGRGAAAYWSAFIRSIRVPHRMTMRATRPPPDAINAGLSFGYALLLSDTIAAAELAGLDPAIGVFHSLRAGRPALALDLMEPFRPAIVDRLVLRSANRRQLRDEHFTESPEGGVLLNRDGRELMISLYAEMLESTDGLGGSVVHGDTWRDLIRRHASALARQIRTALPSNEFALDACSPEPDDEVLT